MEKDLKTLYDMKRSTGEFYLERMNLQYLTDSLHCRLSLRL